MPALAWSFQHLLSLGLIQQQLNRYHHHQLKCYRVQAARWQKFSDSPSLHKTSKKQEDTSNSKPEMDKGQTQQTLTNPESNTGSDSAPAISQMKLCSQFWCFVDNFFQFCPGAFSQNTWIKPCKKIFKVLPSVYVKKFDLSIKKCQGQPNVINFSKFIGPMSQMLHTKPQGHWFYGSREEDF